MVPIWVPIVVAVIGIIPALLVYLHNRRITHSARSQAELTFIHEERESLIEGFADIAEVYRKQVIEAEQRIRAVEHDCTQRMLGVKMELDRALERIVEMESNAFRS